MKFFEFIVGLGFVFLVFSFYVMLQTPNCLNQYAGLWIPNSVNDSNWVCVNVNGMSIDRMVEVCNHEVGHEIYYRNKNNLSIFSSEDFAEICEKNLTKCLQELE